jgi:hypothetical protein
VCTVRHREIGSNGLRASFAFADFGNDGFSLLGAAAVVNQYLGSFFSLKLAHELLLLPGAACGALPLRHTIGRLGSIKKDFVRSKPYL